MTAQQIVGLCAVCFCCIPVLIIFGVLYEAARQQRRWSLELSGHDPHVSDSETLRGIFKPPRV